MAMVPHGSSSQRHEATTILSLKSRPVSHSTRNALTRNALAFVKQP